jgi:hypothetical protein
MKPLAEGLRMVPDDPSSTKRKSPAQSAFRGYHTGARRRPQCLIVLALDPRDYNPGGHVAKKARKRRYRRKNKANHGKRPNAGRK